MTHAEPSTSVGAVLVPIPREALRGVPIRVLSRPAKSAPAGGEVAVVLVPDTTS